MQEEPELMFARVGVLENAFSKLAMLMTEPEAPRLVYTKPGESHRVTLTVGNLTFFAEDESFVDAAIGALQNWYLEAYAARHRALADLGEPDVARSALG